MSVGLPDRIEAKIERAGCWVWTGCISSNGYARVTWAGRVENAHRVVWRLLTGRDVPTGMEMDHLCRNRACVNPAHLEVVDKRTNTLRGIGPTAINARKTHCNEGHPFTEENTYVESGGGRRCRTCRAEKNRQRRGQLCRSLG